MPFGLIINKVVSNSLKHAFENNPGIIHIDVSKSNDNWIIEVGDNGKGFIKSSDSFPSSSFGMEIIDDLTNQLDGKLFFSGTESSAEFSGYMEGAILSAESVYKKLLV